MTDAGPPDLPGRDRTLFSDLDFQNRFLDVVVEGDDERLQVLDHLVDILDHGRNRLVLMDDALDAEGPHGRALQRRQEYAPDRVAEGVAVAPLQRLEDEICGAAVCRLLGDLDTFGKHETGKINLQIHARNSPFFAFIRRDPRGWLCQRPPMPDHLE